MPSAPGAPLRAGCGLGWALVGDAGYHKNPITAQGITGAFRDAELLAEAVDAVVAGNQASDAGDRVCRVG